MVQGSKWIAAAHGCFDNSIGIVSDTLKRIKGKRRLAEQVSDLEY